MGCNCGGSTPKKPAETLSRPAGQRTMTVKPPAPRRSGGPGEPGYTWNGPPRPKPSE